MSREALRQQFVSLKQGIGTVKDYYMKCDNLMRYAPDIVADDFRLRQQYLEGLNPTQICTNNRPSWYSETSGSDGTCATSGVI